MEYARFGESFVSRKDASHEWKDCPLDDVPQEFLDELEATAARRAGVGAGPQSGTGGVSADEAGD